MCSSPMVWLVDDDTDMRESMVWLLESAGHQVRAFARPHDLHDGFDRTRPGCLLLDLQLPGINGLELYRILRSEGATHPFIVITGHGDVETAMRAMREGAVDFIEKPFDHRILLDRVEQSIAESVKRSDVQTRIDQLTRRERQVMGMVAEGMLTKQIAKKLGISDKTVEVHRSHVTRKMKVRSVVQLVKLITEHTMDARTMYGRMKDERTKDERMKDGRMKDGRMGAPPSPHIRHPRRRA